MSKSADRRVQGYLHPSNFQFVKDRVANTGTTESKVIDEAVSALKQVCNNPLPISKQLKK